MKADKTAVSDDCRDRTSERISVFLSISAAAMAAFAVVLPSGYSIGALFLLIGSVFGLIRSGVPHVDRTTWAIVFAMSAYSTYWITHAALHGADPAAFDQTSRLLLAVPVLLATAIYGLRWAFIWIGIALGGVSTGVIGLYETYVESARRASGGVGPEHFGNLSILFASLSIVGLAWMSETRQPIRYRVIPILGIFGGFAGSLASGTRASWIALLVLLVLITFALLRLRLRRMLLVMAVAILVGSSALATTMDHSSFVTRLQGAAEDISHFYTDGARAGSMSKRFDVWKGSLRLFKEKPLFGWGDRGYQEEMNSLAESGYITKGAARLNHSHNDWLNASSKRGILGLTILAALYFFPIWLYLRFFRSEQTPSDRIISLGGLVASTNFLVYGLAHHALGSNNGVMNFAFWTAIFCGYITNAKRYNELSETCNQMSHKPQRISRS
jgi:O-antigen ligase